MYAESLTNQLLRAGTSIGANVEEGQASQSEVDFIREYSIACKEARKPAIGYDSWLPGTCYPKNA